MATDKDVAKLQTYISNLHQFLRQQRTWQKQVTNDMKKLYRRTKKRGDVGSPPTITTPPKPPPKP
jgi:hypothetical protein